MLSNIINKLKPYFSVPEVKGTGVMARLARKINDYSLRERVLMLMLSLAVLVAVWIFLLMSPLQDSTSALRLQIETQTKQLKELTQEYNQLVGQAKSVSLNKQLKEAESKSVKLNEQITKTVGEVVPVDKMAEMLRGMLGKEGHLSLVSLVALPETSLVDVKGNADKQSLIFRHGIDLIFKGDYFDTMKYLRELEASKWRMFWDQLSYTVGVYPSAVIKMRVYTLIQRKSLNLSIKKPEQTKKVFTKENSTKEELLSAAVKK